MELIENYSPSTNRYDWDDWSDGKWRRARQGEDFDSLGSFRTALVHWAKRNGRKYRTELQSDGSLAFVIYP